jgi:hypothetical protein
MAMMKSGGWDSSLILLTQLNMEIHQMKMEICKCSVAAAAAAAAAATGAVATAASMMPTTTCKGMKALLFGRTLFTRTATAASMMPTTTCKGMKALLFGRTLFTRTAMPMLCGRSHVQQQPQFSQSMAAATLAMAI